MTAEEIEGDLAPLQDVRLLNPTEMLSRFRQDRGTDAGLMIDDLDVDRYEIDGRLQQALIAALELDVDGSPNQSWQGRHLINTRGCGLVMAPVGRVLDSDSPDYQPVELVRPELYFSPSLSGYAVARTSAAERACAWRRDGGLRRRHAACRCRRSSGGPRSPSPSSTTTCSARARSRTTRRCCGCATSATG